MLSSPTYPNTHPKVDRLVWDLEFLVFYPKTGLYYLSFANITISGIHKPPAVRECMNALNEGRNSISSIAEKSKNLVVGRAATF